MSQATDCNCACPTPEIVTVPGVEGDAGIPGVDGSNGISAFTITTEPEDVNAPLDSITFDVAQSDSFAIGQYIFISDGTDWGTFVITAIGTSTSITATFQNVSGDTATPFNLASGAKVTPAGSPPASPLAVANGGTGASTVQTALTNLGLGFTPLTVYAAGTAYQFTNTAALLNFGTTDPSLTLTSAGVYLLLARVRVDYTGATFAAVRTVTLKIRRTNNTAADIANSTIQAQTEIITTLTYTLGVIDLPPIVYTTTNNNDVLEIWGDVDTVPTAGSLDAVEASLVAVKIFNQTL